MHNPVYDFYKNMNQFISSGLLWNSQPIEILHFKGNSCNTICFLLWNSQPNETLHFKGISHKNSVLNLWLLKQMTLCNLFTPVTFCSIQTSYRIVPKGVAILARKFLLLAHLLMDKMAAITQTIFLYAFSWIKDFIFWLDEWTETPTS